jgi:hypothetical protein
MNGRLKLLRWIRVAALGCVLGLLFAFLGTSLRIFPGTGKEATPPFGLSEAPVEKELTRLVELQLSAFRRNDYRRALNYADSSLKSQLSVRAFEKMVKAGYPTIAKSRSANFGVVLDNGEEALVNVGITSDTGRTFHYQYLLKREKDGWRISGVARVKLEGITI